MAALTRQAFGSVWLMTRNWQPAAWPGSLSALALALPLSLVSSLALVPACGAQPDVATSRLDDQLPPSDAGPRVARGILRARNSAALATELSAAITKLPVREAQTFAKGDLLVAFDCRRHAAERKAANAKLREAQLNVESNAYLAERQALGQHDLGISRAQRDKARADLELIEARMADCEIRAPFAGVIAELNTARFERPAPGKPFLRIVSNQNLEIELIVPALWLRWLTVGTTFQFRVDETDKNLSAHVMRVGGVVDPVSQTIKIHAKPQNADPSLKDGMSGSAHFAQAQDRGRLVQRGAE